MKKKKRSNTTLSDISLQCINYANEASLNQFMSLKHLFDDTSSQMPWNYSNSLFYRKFVAKIAIFHAIISRNRKIYKYANYLIKYA